MAIGVRLAHLRKDTHKTLEEVSKATGISPQQISKYEKEIITNIPSDKIETLADYYGVSPAYIMGWEDLDEELPRYAAKTTHDLNVQGLTEEDILAIEEFIEFRRQRKNRDEQGGETKR